jgi:multiple sugar transport system substrate-binding protein
MAKKLTILTLLGVFIIISGFGCKTASKQVIEATKPITLSYWRVFDGSDAFDEIINKYKALHPHITIDYRKLRYEEYESELLNAMAEDRGPDIFSIQNTWMGKYQSKLVPMPETITMAYVTVQGSVQKEAISAIQTNKSITVKELRDNFVDVVNHDVILNDGKIYGLPLSVDTLVMFYNKDLFNNAGISQVPQYWNKEFLQDIKKLTKQDPKKGIVQSGAALGSASNINRYSDIISVLMLQNGAVMEDDGGQVVFNQVPPLTKDTNYNPGLEALRFYTDFANPLKDSYTWNNDMPNSLDAFISGNLAIMFGYSYDVPTIKAQAPKLNFSIAKLPQIEGNPINTNFANYWVEVVSKKSKNQNEAWDFIQFITKEEQVKSYLEKTKKPTALRSLVQTQKNDDDLSVFADQVLTAKSWYKGVNAVVAEEAIKEMINSVLVSTSDKLQSILNTAASRVAQTIN